MKISYTYSVDGWLFFLNGENPSNSMFLFFLLNIGCSSFQIRIINL